MTTEELQTRLSNYIQESTSENLEKLRTALKTNQLYFNKFFRNTEGSAPEHSGNYNETGRFLEFAESTNYQEGELLQISCEGKGMVYVQTSDITLS